MAIASDTAFAANPIIPLNFALNGTIGTISNPQDGNDENVNPNKNLNYQDAHGFTNLMIAAMEGKYNKVLDLCKRGANANIRDNQGLTAIWWAACKNRWFIVELLLPYSRKVLEVKPSSGEYQGASILWFAAEAQQWSLVETLLIKYGVRDLDTTIETGEKAGSRILDFAVLDENLKMIILLFSLGSTINLKRAITPLMFSFSSPNVFQCLMTKCNAAVDVAIPNGFSLEEEHFLVKRMRSAALFLFKAIRENKLSQGTLKSFLNAGAHFNQRSIHENNSPLHMTISLKRISACEIILKEMMQTQEKHRDELLKTFLCASNERDHTPLDTALVSEQSTTEELFESEVKHLSLPEQTIKLIFGYLPLLPNKKLVSMLMNTIQVIINKNIFELQLDILLLRTHRSTAEQRSLLTQPSSPMSHVPLELTKLIHMMCEKNQFAKTPSGIAHVKWGYSKAFASKKIHQSLEARKNDYLKAMALKTATAQTPPTAPVEELGKENEAAGRSNSTVATTKNRSAVPSKTLTFNSAIKPVNPLANSSGYNRLRKNS